jgi:geranylgeranyl pyrophosphate synthase
MTKSVIKTIESIDFAEFSKTLEYRQNLINAELESISQEIITDTTEQFGIYPAEVINAYIAVLLRGGKRIRGALAMEAYEMFGGKDQDVIVKAACALEMLNTYVLVADDIQDRSLTRRGGPTAHIILKKYHDNLHLKGDSQHFGEAAAISSFLIAQHLASNILLQLPVEESVRIRALVSVNKSFVITGHGQTLDIFSEAVEDISEQDIYNILSWKTAYYTFINPMQLGAILAGASEQQISPLVDYGLNAGRVFQLTDDIIGTFGNELDTGKSSLDDIKEGKRTLLIVSALKAASSSDAYFLSSCLGNQNITMSEFKRCKNILEKTGALSATKQAAMDSATEAIEVLDTNSTWPLSSRKFLQDLVGYLLIRKS